MTRRARPRDVGSPPDPRFTFANERTFLAWNRTALALMVAGLAVSQLIDFGFAAAELLVSLPLILLGVAISVVSYRNWEANERALRLGEPLEYRALDRIVAVGIAFAAIVAAVVVVVDHVTG